MARESKLDRLTSEERKELIERLYKRQDGLSYISKKSINLKTDPVDIDHIIALDRNGPDTESNWGLVLSNENRSKGTRDLQLMRYIDQFRKHRDQYLQSKRNFTFGDALSEFYPKRKPLKAEISENVVKISFEDNGVSKELEFPLLTDEVDKTVKSFIGMLSFSTLYHDTTINPRPIVDLEPMVEEFYNKNPQLLPSLAILEVDENNSGKIQVFDGQHKAAAQLYVRSPKLFVRVFVNADKVKIKRTNFRAHTLLAQIHFPQLISDKVGHHLFSIEFGPYLETVDWDKEDESTFLKREEMSTEYKGYLKNWLKYRALMGNEDDRHKILDYVETVSARSKKYPISYDTLSKTFLKLLYLSPSKDNLFMSQKYRKLELENLKRLMEIYVDEVLDGKFDLDKGIYKLEKNLREDPDSIHDNHLVAYRMCRSAAMIIWIEELKKAIARLLKSGNKYYRTEWSENRILWTEIGEQEWEQIRNMIKVIKMHQVWKQKENEEALSSLGSTKQGEWKGILLDGRLPGREERLFEPLTDTKIYDTAISM